MNTERLKDVVGSLVDDERRYKIKSHLQNVHNGLQQLAGSPGNADFQSQVMTYLAALEDHLNQIVAQYDPPKLSQFNEIGALEYFSPEMAISIRQDIQSNAMTPAVVHENVVKLQQRRDSYIETITQVSSGLTTLGFYSHELSEGEAEIGFCPASAPLEQIRVIA